MSDKVSKIVIFAVGAALGSASTWFLLKKKYEQIAQEEIDSVKEIYAAVNDAKEQVDENECDSKSSNPYEGMLNALNLEEREQEVIIETAVIIPPSEFGENEDYEQYTLTYYANGVLTDEYDNPIEDDLAYIGCEFLNGFGEYEEDSVCIRNDDAECYYEILKDESEFPVQKVEE